MPRTKLQETVGNNPTFLALVISTSLPDVATAVVAELIRLRTVRKNIQSTKSFRRRTIYKADQIVYPQTSETLTKDQEQTKRYPEIQLI